MARSHHRAREWHDLLDHVASVACHACGTVTRKLVRNSLLLVLLIPLSDDVWLFIAPDMLVPIIVRVYIVENVPGG